MRRRTPSATGAEASTSYRPRESNMPRIFPGIFSVGGDWRGDWRGLGAPACKTAGPSSTDRARGVDRRYSKIFQSKKRWEPIPMKSNHDIPLSPMPYVVDAAGAVELLRCSRSNFFTRVREGVYRTATLRAGDAAPKMRLFRPCELVSDEVRRLEAVQRAGGRVRV